MQSETEYFRRVYEATYEDMLRYTVIKTRRAADIEDILQNAYSRFFSRITRRGHGDIDDPKAYLMSILQKELSGFYRFKIIKAEKEQRMTDGMTELSVEDIEDSAINAEMLGKVWDEIASAPAESYKAFVLYYYLDMTVADIARELNLSESAVKSRIHRLRASVRPMCRMGRACGKPRTACGRRCNRAPIWCITRPAGWRAG